MTTTRTRGGAICPEEVAAYREAFASDPRYGMALNAVTKTSIQAVATRRDAVVRNNHTFSHMVKSGTATAQNRSGRCWMFAGLNTFRMAAAEEMNLEDFELSQNYLMFWDKLEKANFFLENILSTLDEPTDGRLIAWLMGSPIQDGGQWDMFVNLVKKYGVVPKEIMPETESSGNSHLMNDAVTYKLREAASRLRGAHQSGASPKSLCAEKEAAIAEVYRMLAIHLGEPPTEFLWQWRDKDKNFHRDGYVSPQKFFQRRVPVNLDETVCLIHCPQSGKQYNTLYTIDYLGNVVGGQIIRYVNVEMQTLKQAAIAMIRDEKPVWFGCDVGKMLDRDLGLMDVDLYDYGGVYGTQFGMDKATRLDYGQSLMTHAMVFAGVDLDEDGAPRKWRVENSWGDKAGDKGYMVMTDAWFDQYVYEVAVLRSHVPADVVALLDSEPVHLPPWDPMGSLAASSI